MLVRASSCGGGAFRQRPGRARQRLTCLVSGESMVAEPGAAGAGAVCTVIRFELESSLTRPVTSAVCPRPETGVTPRHQQHDQKHGAVMPPTAPSENTAPSLHQQHHQKHGAVTTSTAPSENTAISRHQQHHQKHGTVTTSTAPSENTVISRHQQHHQKHGTVTTPTAPSENTAIPRHQQHHRKHGTVTTSTAPSENTAPSLHQHQKCNYHKTGTI